MKLISSALLLVCLSARPVFAQLPEATILEKVLQQLQFKPEDCQEQLIVQRVMPYAKQQSVVIIPRTAEADEYSFTCHAYILIVNNMSGNIIQRFYERDAWTSDAVRLQKISIDFAPYKLNAATRAFGVKVLYEGDSRPNPYESEELSLFIPRGNTMERVLKNLPVSTIQGDWDTNCEGQFTTARRILIISEKKTNNFFDIIVKSKTTTTDKSVVDGECNDVDTITNESVVLTFNDKEYK